MSSEAPLNSALPDAESLPAIEVRGLGKAYAIFERPADRLKQMLSFGRRRYYSEYWALRDLHLTVNRGETFAIIGRNGSGKSTLLQLICGTLRPSTGEITIRGRIAALLELGAGFNPEFTGRENVFLNAALLGLSRAETAARFDDIAAFADIGRYLDQPVKTYSSGMFARLAFAVAIHVDPDILVVDEALSVGDELFQRKCFNRIRQLQEQGVTVLVVSHSAATVTELCDRALVLDGGERVLLAPSKTAIIAYHKLIHARPDSVAQLRAEFRQLDTAITAGLVLDLPQSETSVTQQGPLVLTADPMQTQRAEYIAELVPESRTAYLPNGAEILDPEIQDLDGRLVNLLVQGDSYRISYRVVFHREAFKVRFGCMIKTLTGVELMGVNSHRSDSGMSSAAAGTALKVSFEFRNIFLPQLFFLNVGVVALVDGEEMFLHRIVDAAMFRVQPSLARPVAGYIDATADPFCTIAPDAV
jgi:lipopolysaccharide transport system ATP-binding protein